MNDDDKKPAKTGANALRQAGKKMRDAASARAKYDQAVEDCEKLPNIEIGAVNEDDQELILKFGLDGFDEMGMTIQCENTGHEVDISLPQIEILYTKLGLLLGKK